jgi:DNA polymerase-1
MLSKEGVHRRVYGRIYNIDPTTVTDAQKSIAKPVVFGTFYGQQADGLAELLKIPLEQAEDLIARFFNQYPGLKFWIDSTISCARKLGYVDTVFGRRRYLPAINSPDMKSRANSEHYAVNTPIQATCHDLLIIASVKIMRDIQTESLPMALVAENHDAFIYEVRDDAVEECQAIIKRRMEEPVIPELIPMQAEIEISKSWKAKIDEEVPDAPEVPVADEVVLA